MLWIGSVPWATVVAAAGVGAAALGVAAAVIALRQRAWLRYWRREALVMAQMNQELIAENERLFATVRAAEGTKP